MSGTVRFSTHISFNILVIVLQKRVTLTNYLVHRVVVFKRNEGEAPSLVTVLFSHDVHFIDFPKLAEVVTQVFLVRVLFNSSYKDLLHGGVSARPARVLDTTTAGKHAVNTPKPLTVSHLLYIKLSYSERNKQT